MSNWDERYGRDDSIYGKSRTNSSIAFLFNQWKKSMRNKLSITIRVVLLVAFLCILFSSCSNCVYVRDSYAEKLEKAEKGSLKIRTIEGKEYYAKEFKITGDTLVFIDLSTPPGKKNKEKRLALDSITSIRYCEFSSDKAFFNGLKFVLWLSIPYIILLLLFKDATFSPGG